eukprot:gnl/TRDRNA2_/TRDRNA2_170793_c0_seq5.p1 gnl/TRDRNA2_/TRDRNA2_170793_c0~~gnl/TRDRNA2_/TRDRNA2_170793_c0_seq5.p1  ORF type:complete len:409 (+),score=47.52 gnl/TRDRNA2_/TRDRNA2_170793_c0_seq5:160-1227(+)
MFRRESRAPSELNLETYLDTCQKDADAIRIEKWMGRTGNRLIQLSEAFRFAMAAGRKFVKLDTPFCDFNEFEFENWDFTNGTVTTPNHATDCIFDFMDFNHPNVLHVRALQPSPQHGCEVWRTKEHYECKSVYREFCKTSVAMRRQIYESQIKPYLRSDVWAACEAGREDTITIHMRDGDVAHDTSSHHAQPPCLYFETVIESGYNGSSFKYVDLVHDGEQPLNPCVDVIKSKYADKILHNKGTGVTDSAIKVDSCKVLKANNLAMTTSSFAGTLALMNNQVSRYFYADTFDEDVKQSLGSGLFVTKMRDMNWNLTEVCQVWPKAQRYSFGKVHKNVGMQLLNFPADHMYVDHCA